METFNRMNKNRMNKNRKCKRCKRCKKKLHGEMIFNPDLCLSCVIDKHAKNYKYKMNSK